VISKNPEVHVMNAFPRAVLHAPSKISQSHAGVFDKVKGFYCRTIFLWMQTYESAAMCWHALQEEEAFNVERATL